MGLLTLNDIKKFQLFLSDFSGRCIERNVAKQALIDHHRVDHSLAEEIKKSYEQTSSPKQEQNKPVSSQKTSKKVIFKKRQPSILDLLDVDDDNAANLPIEEPPKKKRRKSERPRSESFVHTIASTALIV